MDPRFAWLKENGFRWNLLTSSSRHFDAASTGDSGGGGAIPQDAITNDGNGINKNFDQQSSSDEPTTTELETDESAGCYLCTQCGKAFDSDSRLEHHVISVHEIEDADDVPNGAECYSDDTLPNTGNTKTRGQHKYACKLCPRTFTVSSALNVHYTHTHKDKPQYDCEMCGRAFTVKRELATHRRMHDGQPTHKCRQCGKEFGTKQLLRKHELWHTGERAHVCPQCGKAFFQKGHLTQHLLIHAGGRPHVCVLCGKTFIFKFDLNRHMKIHAERIIVAAGGGAIDSSAVDSSDKPTENTVLENINAFLETTENAINNNNNNSNNHHHDGGVSKRILSPEPVVDCPGDDSVISDVSPVNSVSSTSAGSIPCCDQCISYKTDLDLSQRRMKDLQQLLEQRNQELEALKSKILRVGDVTGQLLETCSDFDKFWMLHSKKIYSQIQNVLNALQ